MCRLGLGQQAVLIGTGTRDSLTKHCCLVCWQDKQAAAGCSSQLTSTPVSCHCTGSCPLTEYQYWVTDQSQVA